MPVRLLGTSHISPKSATAARDAVRSGAYDIVALELDHPRLLRLLHGDAREARFSELVRAVGLSGAVFAKAGQWIERKLGGRVGTEPGEEMRAAFEEARARGLKVALIDQPLPVTLRRFSKEFTWREKLRVLASVLRFERIPFDLTGVPDERTVRRMLAQLERVSPALVRVLVHERNEYMCARLRAIQERFPDARILAVVGAGHVPGLAECLNTPSGQKRA